MNMKPYILLSLLYYIMLQAIPLFKMKHKFSIAEIIDGMKLETEHLGALHWHPNVIIRGHIFMY